jgi:gamma-glutamylcyclotransferase (GGCT)/AIG2-like uncharacterized protein YtfP
VKFSQILDPHYGPALQGIAAMIAALGVATGAYQLWLNRRSASAARRVESTKKITELYERFYQISSLQEEDRIDFEYNFFHKYAPSMERWLRDPNTVSAADQKILARIDTILNFFEHTAHLSQASRSQLLVSDRIAAFDYWFTDVMRRGTHAVLRRYLQHSFECIGSLTKFRKQPVFLAVYGTLMSGEFDKIAGHDELKRRMRGAKYRGSCRISGQIYAYRGNGLEFPYLCLDSGDASVAAELFEIGKTDAEAASLLRVLDAYENEQGGGTDFQPTFIPRCLLVTEGRRRWPLWGKPRQYAAWVYVVAHPLRDALPVPSGDWKAYNQSPS